jgi:FtsZ-interacting cell division protein ZipA
MGDSRRQNNANRLSLAHSRATFVLLALLLSPTVTSLASNPQPAKPAATRPSPNPPPSGNSLGILDDEAQGHQSKNAAKQTGAAAKESPQEDPEKKVSVAQVKTFSPLSWVFLAWAILATVALGMLAIVLLVVKGKFKRERIEYQRKLGQVNEQKASMESDYATTKRHADELQKLLDKEKADHATIKRRAEDLQKLLDMEKAAHARTKQQLEGHGEALTPNFSAYPSSPSQILKRAGNIERLVFNPILNVFDSDPSGEFAAFQENGSWVMVPSYERMESANDYFSRLAMAFECSDPRRAEFRVVRPAEMEPVEPGRYRIRRKGELEAE